MTTDANEKAMERDLRGLRREIKKYEDDFKKRNNRRPTIDDIRKEETDISK